MIIHSISVVFKLSISGVNCPNAANFEETLLMKEETNRTLQEVLERADEIKLTPLQIKTIELLINIGDHKKIREILECTPAALRSNLYNIRRKCKRIGIILPQGSSRYS